LSVWLSILACLPAFAPFNFRSGDQDRCAQRAVVHVALQLANAGEVCVDVLKVDRLGALTTYSFLDGM
jgi:hypothetical protein